MSWTINENSKTSTTEYFNATATDMTAGSPDFEDTDFQNIAGYVSGTINFTISPAPNSVVFPLEWDPNSTVVISIIGRIDTQVFEVLPNLHITQGDPNSTFSIKWDIPLEDVALRLNNGDGVLFPPLIPTGQTITISNISMQTESQGGGVGHQAGTSVAPLAAPAPPVTTLQYNDSGYFASTSQPGPPPFMIIVAYDKMANQLQLPSNTAALPILAFSDGSGTYDNGIFRAAVDAVGFAAGGNKIVGVYGAAAGNFIKGLNVGIDSASPGGVNICGIRRLSATPANSWEDGWMGNSSQLVFTGSDFTDFNTRTFNPVPFAVASPIIQGGFGLIAGAAAPAQGDEFVAVKVIPKGFRILRDPRRPVIVATADQTAAVDVWGSSGPPPTQPTIQLLIQDINNTLAPPPNPTSLGAAVNMTDWTAAGLKYSICP